MTDFSKATPRPWTTAVPSIHKKIVSASADHEWVCDVRSEANAALIVEAVNSYEPMKARIAGLERQINDWREGDLAGVMAHWDAAEARIAELEAALEGIRDMFEGDPIGTIACMKDLAGGGLRK